MSTEYVHAKYLRTVNFTTFSILFLFIFKLAFYFHNDNCNTHQYNLAMLAEYVDVTISFQLSQQLYQILIKVWFKNSHYM